MSDSTTAPPTATATNEAPTPASSSSTDASPASSAAASSSSSSTSASSSAPFVAPATVLGSNKKYKVAEVPEGADPLDYINFEKLKEDNKNMPTTKEGINAMFNEMPLTADIMPEKESMNRDFAGIQSIIDETPIDARAENFKDSGNEAYKLSVRMTKDHKEGMAKREAAEAERLAKGLPKPILTSEQEKEEKYELAHLAKLVESSKKRLIDAVVYYTQALDVEGDAEREGASSTKISKHLKAQIYANRALVHMTMQNYGKTQADCDEALKLEPKNAKAAFRGASACLAIHPPKLEKARTYIQAGRILDEPRKKIDWQFRAEQKSMDELEARVVKFENEIRAKEEKKKAEADKAALVQSGYAQGIHQALLSRGLKLGPLVFNFADSAYAAQTKEAGQPPRPYLYPPYPAPYTSATTLGWPLLILYPDELQSDFIQECKEDHMLIDHLAQMFPPNCDYAPWDQKKKYHLDNISVWIDVRGPNIPPNSTAEQDHASRMLVNPRQTLRAILSNPKLLKKNYVIPGIPMFIVLPKQ